jgi:hypothetical protein
MRIPKVLATVICAAAIGGGTSLQAAEPTSRETHGFIEKMIKQSGARDTYGFSINSYHHVACYVNIEADDSGMTYRHSFNLENLSNVRHFHKQVALSGRVEQQRFSATGRVVEWIERELNLYFDSSSRAERVAKAFAHVIKLCAGGQNDPF